MVCPNNPDDSYSATLTITSSDTADTTPVMLTVPTGQIDVLVANSKASAAPGAKATWLIDVQSLAGPATSISFAPELGGSGAAPPASLVSIPTITSIVPRRGKQTMTLTATVAETTPPGSYSFFVAETVFNDTFSPFSLSLSVTDPAVVVTSTQPNAFSVAVGSQLQFSIDAQIPGAGTNFEMTIDQLPSGLSCTFLDAQGNPIPAWNVALLSRQGMSFPVRVALTSQSGSVENLTFSWSAYNGSEKGQLSFNITVVPQSKTFTAVVNTPAGTALGGSVTLTVRSDGSYVFSGNMHDSGFDPYDFRIRVLLTAPNYVVATQKSGHTDGTGSNPTGSVNRDCDWNEPGTNPAIEMFWSQVSQGVMTVKFFIPGRRTTPRCGGSCTRFCELSRGRICRGCCGRRGDRHWIRNHQLGGRKCGRWWTCGGSCCERCLYGVGTHCVGARRSRRSSGWNSNECLDKESGHNGR